MLDRNDVRKVAELSRLYFSPEEEVVFFEEFSNILSFVELINELDTSEIEPSPYPIDIPNLPREDAISKFGNIENIYENFPQIQGSFLVVPKVIEK